jgi:hypothetical protein
VKSFMCVMALLVTQPTWAAILPSMSVYGMCDRADLIVEGEWLGENRVRVERVHKGAELIRGETDVVEVSRLDDHDREMRGWLGGERGPLGTTRLVAFLAEGEQAETWSAIYTVPRSGRCGSCGVIWYDDARCYSYMQVVNPGPYVLVAAEPAWRCPNIEALRSEIAEGLEYARSWHEALETEDPAEKARVLATYLLPRTSPIGASEYYYEHAARDALVEMKGDAVDALAEVLRTAEKDDNLNLAVNTLYWNRSEAREAAPLLCELLNHPEQVFTFYVLRALETAGEPDVIERVRPYLEPASMEGPDLEVAVQAAATLCALGDQDSFQDIVALLRAILRGGKHLYYVSDTVRAMQRLDAERTALIIRTLINDPRLEGYRSLLEDYLKNPP